MFLSLGMHSTTLPPPLPGYRIVPFQETSAYKNAHEPTNSHPQGTLGGAPAEITDNTPRVVPQSVTPRPLQYFASKARIEYSASHLRSDDKEEFPQLLERAVYDIPNLEDLIKEDKDYGRALVLMYVNHYKELKIRNIKNPVTVAFIKEHLMEHPDFKNIIGDLIDHGYPPEDLFQSIMWDVADWRLEGPDLQKDLQLQLEMAQSFIKHVDVTKPFSNGRFPLHSAIMCEPLPSLWFARKLVESLLDKGVDVNAESREEGYAIQYAYDSNIMKLLIDRGAKINVLDKEGNTLLHRAQSWGTMKLLLQKGLDPNAVNMRGKTALHMICGKKYAHIASVKLLIQNGANLDIRDENGQTPLQYAETQASDPKIWASNRTALIDLLKAVQVK